MPDRPVRRPEDDLLDRGPFVDSLVRALVRDLRDPSQNIVGRQSTGYVVGLTGKWGSGKSSILRLLALKLGSMSHVVVAYFNPWLFRGRDELVRGFFNALRVEMGSGENVSLSELRGFFERYWRSIDFAGHATAAAVDISGASGVATGTYQTVRTWIKPVPIEALSPNEERRALEVALAKTKTAVVVLIDELDRTEDEDVRAVAQLVKAVGEIEGISYLVAYDPERVALALGRGSTEDERRRTGESYLEKIVQYPIPVRPLFSADVDVLIRQAFRASALEELSSADEYEREISRALYAATESPRDIKRLVGTYAVLVAATRDEVSKHDVLAYSWILTKAPTLASAIAARIDMLVDDPVYSGTAEHVADVMSDKKKTPVEVLGEGAVPFTGLLTALFPKFSSFHAEAGSNRICWRRNLIRLLYLGNPPGMFSLEDIRTFWGSPRTGIVLEGLQGSGRLSSLLDRLADAMDDLPQTGDSYFWPEVSRLTTRETDWVKIDEQARPIIDDAATIIVRHGFRNTAGEARAKNIVGLLIERGDLVISPWILRKHLFAHGLTRHGPARGGRMVYSKEETELLLEAEVPRYREAVFNGVLLRRITNSEAIHALSNTNKWDADLRLALTEQINTNEAIETLANIFVPPGSSAERSHLNEIFDASDVLSRIEERGDVANWCRATWLAKSVEHLRRILSGVPSD